MVAPCAVSAHHLRSVTVGMNCTGGECIKAWSDQTEWW